MQTDNSMRNDWGVLHSIRNESEEVSILRLRVQDVPEGIGRKQIKTALERAGRVFGEGDYVWGNHKILPHDEWLELDQAAAEGITYTDLLDEAKGEKRVTVRFPIGLHNALAKAARGKSFNQFCIDVMGAAVGYEQDPLVPAVPRLAEILGVSEAEMAERMQRMAEGVKPTLTSPLTQKLGHGLTNIAGLPADQQKQMIMSLVSNPQFIDDYQRAVQESADFSEEQLAEMSEKLGLSVEETRERLGKVRALPAGFMEQGLNGLKMASPDQVKDINLLLRDTFTGSLPLATPASETSEAAL